MKLREDQRGFSLLEMVITVGIIAIVAGLSINLIGHIRVTSTETVVKTMTAAMTKIQVNAMRRSGTEKPYLYIYPVDGTYYYISSTETSFNSTTMNANTGAKLGDGVKIYKDAISDPNLVTSTNVIRLSYKKDGSFLDDVDDCFFVQGAYTAKITLNKKTGKYSVEVTD